MHHETLVREINAVTREVFATMLNMHVQSGTPAEEAVASGGQASVVALVGLAGAWSGTGAVSCTAALACRIASHMVLGNFDGVNDEVLDAMGEVANMVVGNIKNNLEVRIGPMGLSVPTVIYGRNFTMRAPGKHLWTVVPFACEGECMSVHTVLAQSASRSSAQHLVPVMQHVS